jgi:hypothetical protein
LPPTTRKAHVVAVMPGLLSLLALISAGRQPRLVRGLLVIAAPLLILSTSLRLDHVIPGLGSNPTILIAVIALGAGLGLAQLPQSSIPGEGKPKVTP